MGRIVFAYNKLRNFPSGTYCTGIFFSIMIFMFRSLAENSPRMKCELNMKLRVLSMARCCENFDYLQKSDHVYCNAIEHEVLRVANTHGDNGSRPYEFEHL